MRYLKRFLAWLLFLAGLVAALYITSCIVTPKDNTAKAGMEQPRANGILSERPDSIDVLILGDSESYNAISPLLLWDELGCTSYVCGTNSQRLPYTKTMLEPGL